jgi:hypothetical protein
MFPRSKIFLIREKVCGLCKVTNRGIASIWPVHELRLGLGFIYLVFSIYPIGNRYTWVHAKCKVCIPIGNTKLRDGGTTCFMATYATVIAKWISSTKQTWRTQLHLQLSVTSWFPIQTQSHDLLHRMSWGWMKSLFQRERDQSEPAPPPAHQ